MCKKETDMGLNKMLEEYRQALAGLYRRREEVWRELGCCGRRLAVLEEEIDEMEEAIMQMRPYAAQT